MFHNRWYSGIMKTPILVIQAQFSGGTHYLQQNTLFTLLFNDIYEHDKIPGGMKKCDGAHS